MHDGFLANNYNEEFELFLREGVSIYEMIFYQKFCWKNELSKAPSNPEHSRQNHNAKIKLFHIVFHQQPK
jgi:hypothetical protein